jgi:hypothetical protein
MKTEKLMQNMIDQMIEAQLKLGYAKESILLYYPVSSLNSLLETDYPDAASLCEALRENFNQPCELGQLDFAIHSGRIQVGISPEGAQYVHEHIAIPQFLKNIIELFQTHHSCSLDEILAVFARTGDYICEKMPEGSDFDFVLYFKDSSLDPYYYCIKMEMGHTIYHRFLKEDYEELL